MKKKKQKKPRNLNEEEYFGFAFIAGYTSGGVPYGTTKEEASESETQDDDLSLDPSDLPF